MSKENQVLEDSAVANLCTYYVGPSPAKLISVNGEFETMDFITFPKQLKLSLRSIVTKTEKQPYIFTPDKSAKFKKIHQAFQLLASNTDLLFVLTAFYELNTHIVSL